MIDPVNDLYAQYGDRPSYVELESALLDGAAAIHCLTAERNQLRSRLESQDHELLRLRATNEDLRRQIAVIGDSYMRFATSCVTQLQYVGHAMQEVEKTQTESSELRA
jgi:hypothetical protein